MKDDLSTVRCTVSPFLNHASVLISECKDSESYHQTVCCYFIPSGNMAEWKSNMSFAKDHGRTPEIQIPEVSTAEATIECKNICSTQFSRCLFSARSYTVN